MSKEIKVINNVLRENDAIAQRNRQILDQHGILAINLISAPGSGKTTLLERTLDHLKTFRYAILVGDLQTARDAERLQRDDVPSIQINTGRGCHLSAAQVEQGLAALDLDEIDILFIENVGNMVCPNSFQLGEHRRVALLSTPEGDDKVAKYPVLFQGADAILINKIDLAEHLDFKLDRVLADIAQLNTRAPVLKISALKEIGLDEWFQWLTDTVNECRARTP